MTLLVEASLFHPGLPLKTVLATVSASSNVDSQMQFRVFELQKQSRKLNFVELKKASLRCESEQTPRVPLNGTSNAIKV